VDAKEQYIRSRKIKQLYFNSFIPAALSSLIATFLVAALWTSTSHRALMIWFGITILAGVVRVALISAFKAHNPAGEQLLKWEKPYAISLFIVILNWSIGLLIIMPKDNLNGIFMISTFSVGLAAAAASWYGQIRYIQLSTVCIALIPIIIALLTYGAPETFWVGIAACFMLLGVLSTSHLFQQTLNESLSLAYDLEASIEKVKAIANTDALTALYNRRAFFEMAPNVIQDCAQTGSPVSLIAFDIDYFKKINDTFGHAAGDIALQRVAALLSKKSRASDICCRVGGEEFAILLPNTNIKKAMHIAEKFRNAIETMSIVLSKEKSITLTASFGISNIGDTIDALLNHADQAMYQAKHNGRNQVLAYSTALDVVPNKAKSRTTPRKTKKDHLNN